MNTEQILETWKINKKKITTKHTKKPTDTPFIPHIPKSSCNAAIIQYYTGKIKPVTFLNYAEDTAGN